MLNNLPSPKTNKKSKRLGRGSSSGTGGHTVGRGLKGQTARNGHKSPRPGFEGGQNPIAKRLPKYRGAPKNQKGFTGRGHILARIDNSPVQLSQLAELVKENQLEEITVSSLIEFGLVSPRYNKDLVVKVLFDKEIDAKIVVKGVPVSKSAKAAIEKAGGSVE
jgi:large subunit ribosomal protein L15